MKNRILYVITTTSLVLGAFSAKTYVDNRNVADVYEISILTAAQDIPVEDGVIIGENAIPLAGGPGETEVEAVPVSDDSGVMITTYAAESVSSEHPNVQKVINMVNAEREKAGLAPLVKDAGLCSAASVRAREIASSFSHTRPDGRSYKTALDEEGVAYSGAGENVAMGYQSPAEVMNGWMESEGHRGNILSGKYTSIGVGYYKAGNGYCYWAQSFSY